MAAKDRRTARSRENDPDRRADLGAVVEFVPEWILEEGWTRAEARSRMQTRLAEETASLKSAIADDRWNDVLDTVAGIDCLVDMWCEAVGHRRYDGAFVEVSA